MSAPARLLALRLQGFKSFAERTSVEFGPGISAIVGPNGSGKSNLADALRWTLGEQGRALRSRKAEDVIWAGSERRSAQGMADVTLVVDNADGLIPVDYQVLELGRRLYRSGENDYLLNKQRIRLRDLVDLLDSAHLADNAFLFIGQGMVDQALALRPEERRPLFEEVAGVRRHERRRRRAEEQLSESEANLARAQDILGELRPQVRRLATQAEQQTTRRSAGTELADALVTAAHGRWHAATARLATTAREKEKSEAGFDAALSTQIEAEGDAATIVSGLEARAARERELASQHEAIRATLVELQLRDARLAAEEAALERDRQRLADERDAAEAELAVTRRDASVPDLQRDRDLEASLAEAERALGDALAQLGELRASRRAQGEELAAMRRAETARIAETETARRRLADAERRLAEELERARELETRRAALVDAGNQVAARLLAEVDAVGAAVAARDLARADLDRRESERSAIAERVAGATHELAGLRGRLEALERRIAAEEERGIARAARRRGGRQVDADLLVDASLRSAVETALADRRRAYVVGRAAVIDLAAERGALIVEERLAAQPLPAGVAERRCRDRVAALGGGMLEDAIRRDPSGAVRRLLRRAAWLPDLDSCLQLQADLPPGWVAVTRDGSAVVSELEVTLGKADGTLHWQVDATRLRADIESLSAAVHTSRQEQETADAEVASARACLVDATARERSLATSRREAEEAERRAARDAETALRELGWHEAQVARLTAEAARLRAALPDETHAPASREGPGAARGAAPDGDDPAAALATWEQRADTLRRRRDELAGAIAIQDRAVRAAQEARAQAVATVAGAEGRIRRADEESARSAERAIALAVERQAVRSELLESQPREEHARQGIERVRVEDRGERQRLAAAETALAGARELVRACEERTRSADRLDLEARLAFEALREHLLVELAALGEDGIARLRGGSALGDVAPATLLPDGASDVGADDADPIDPDVAALEQALEAASATWAAEPPRSDLPTPGRLAALRRRYHELGAANPYAIEEYDTLRERLRDLETQEADLRKAIASTRELIAQLNALIATQFRATFVSLESAFDQRFRQLFGGGYARLALTDPEDLSTTGVEIVARPPGKKQQALAMLSGGERALTAVALLFAMLTVRPVPFCVLDEVDAALDEANVGRFADVLRELAAQTQFIVITHNRGTIERADALYGVTVGDDSVSRVISLRLEEAQAIAARAPHGSSADHTSLEPAVR